MGKDPYNPYDEGAETNQIPIAHPVVTDGDRMLFYGIKKSYHKAIRLLKSGIDKRICW